MSQIVYKTNINEKIFSFGIFKTKTLYLMLQNEIRLFEMHLHAWPFAKLDAEIDFIKKLSGYMNIPNRVVCCQNNSVYKYLSPIYGGCLAEELLSDFNESVGLKIELYFLNKIIFK